MRRLALLPTFFVAVFSQPTLAASSTSSGQVSVAQVVEMIEKSGSNRSYRNIALAYFSGVGEAAGVLIQEAASKGVSMECSGRLELSTDHAMAAVTAGGERNWRETAATPLILADMLARAGCK